MLHVATSDRERHVLTPCSTSPLRLPCVEMAASTAVKVRNTSPTFPHQPDKDQRLLRIAVDQPPTLSDCAISHIAPIREHIPFIERCRKAIPPGQYGHRPIDQRPIRPGRAHILHIAPVSVRIHRPMHRIRRFLDISEPMQIPLAYFLLDLSTDLKQPGLRLRMKRRSAELY